MHELDQLLATATKAIAPGFYLLPIVNDAGKEIEIYRERVYCYELYHQLRMEWDKIKTPYVLNGEVSKNKHPYFGSYGPQPDFLVHVPRTHDNYAVIEVKKCDADGGFKKDLNTFERFLSHDYKRCIYIVYGITAESTARSIIEINEQREAPVPIEMWIHPKPGDAAFPLGYGSRHFFGQNLR